MKKKFLTFIFLVAASLPLFAVSCARTCSCMKRRPYLGETMTFQEVLRMPPFTATVEHVRFHGRIFGPATSVELLLAPPENLPLLVKSGPADRNVVGFARSLQKDASYIFPQAYLDYVNRRGTMHRLSSANNLFRLNLPKKPPHSVL